MTPISYVIIDDEAGSKLDLQVAIRQLPVALNELGYASTVDEAITLINTLKPELAFFDVELNNRLSFEILPKLTFIPTIIFVTAHEHYSLRAIRSNAFDYLLKPVDSIELNTAIQRFLTHREVKEIQRDWQQMKEQMLSSLSETLKKPNQIEKLLIRQSGKLLVVKVDEIQIIEGESNYARIYLNDGNRILTSMTLKEIESLLPVENFFRCHKSFVVNLKNVDEVKTLPEPEILLKNGTKVQIARRRVKDLIQQLAQIV
ncbi:response regulator transcription factor [bacterium]|nr:MAG: response regulator transcription factor [bacterium]